MQVFDIVAGILYLVVAAIEAFVILVAALASSFHPVFTILAHDVNSKASLARLFIVAVPIGLIVNLAVNVIEIIAHFTTKVCRSDMPDVITGLN